MRILFLASNKDIELATWARSQNGVDSVLVICEKLTRQLVEEISPNIVISYSYRHIISSEIIYMRNIPFINLHISYLPFNRGADPNIWSFLDDTPKGVTIHLMDEGIDTGPILFQKLIEFPDNVTLESSYNLLQEQIQILFKFKWEYLISGSYSPKCTGGFGTFHTKNQFSSIKNILLDGYGWGIGVDVLRERYKSIISTP